MLSKEVSSTILKVFGMTRPVTEPRFPGPLANTLHARSMNRVKGAHNFPKINVIARLEIELTSFEAAI